MYTKQPTYYRLSGSLPALLTPGSTKHTAQPGRNGIGRLQRSEVPLPEPQPPLRRTKRPNRRRWVRWANVVWRRRICRWLTAPVDYPLQPRPPARPAMHTTRAKVASR